MIDPLFYTVAGKGKRRLNKSPRPLRKESELVGHFSLMETQLGKVRWYREQVVGEGKREARPLIQIQGRPTPDIRTLFQRKRCHIH